MSATEAPSQPTPDVDLPWLQPPGVDHTYDFHCHCGAVRWTVNISPPLYEEHAQGKGVWTAVECDCSYCERSGYICVHPYTQDVTFTRGLENRAEYSFGNKNNAHWFCSKCGSSIGADLTETMKMFGQAPRYLINLRMLKDYDPAKLSIKRMAGMKHMPPKYTVD